jgi:hypothetical protein
MFGAICRSNVLLGGHGQLPSKHRIGSTTAANADQSGGLMLHDFLRRVFFRTFKTWADAAPEGGDDDINSDDFRKILRKKVWKVLHTLEEPHVAHRLITNWLAAKLDHTWMILQQIDAAGHLLRTLVHEDTSPFSQVSRDYTSMIVKPLSDGPLQALIHHFDAQFQLGYIGPEDDVDKDTIINDLRTLTCSLTAQVRWRCEWLFEGKPFMAFLMVDARLDNAAQLRIAVRIHGSPDCELDPFFLRKALTNPPFPCHQSKQKCE